MSNNHPTNSLQRRNFNLPDKTTIYMCIQDLSRRHPSMDNILAKLLNYDYKSILIVSVYGTEVLFNDLKLNLMNLNVKNVDGRVLKAPLFFWDTSKINYYTYLTLADANLAFRGMCGGTIFYDHLSLKIPQIVWPFDNVSNSCAGVYLRMDMNELIASSEEDYVMKAYKLAHDKQWKSFLQHKLTSRLNDFIKILKKENGYNDLEVFFHDSIERAKKGLPAAHWYSGKFYNEISKNELIEQYKIHWKYN
jgi:predicted O-linked N-acetylglucosamine transferase (SPINDLY family)